MLQPDHTGAADDHGDAVEASFPASFGTQENFFAAMTGSMGAMVAFIDTNFWIAAVATGIGKHERQDSC